MKKILLTLILSLSLIPAFTYAADVTIENIIPSTDVTAGTEVSFKLTTYALSPKYILNDSLPGSTVSNSNINAYGRFSWIPSQLDTGTHSINFTVIDTFGNRSNVVQTITVRPPSPISIQDLSPGSSLYPDKTLTFSIAAPGFINPRYTIFDSFSGTSLTSSNISSGGNFSWKPKNSDVGVHSLTIRITSSNGRTENIYQTIVVNGLSINNVSSTQLKVGSTLSFTATTHGMDNPSFRVTDSARNNTIDSISISGNTFRWTPTSADIGNHTITVTATDIYGVVRTNELMVTVSGNDVVTTTPPPTYTSTPPVNTYIFTTNLSFGSNGIAVTELQKRLKAEGYLTATPNGNFGPQTKQAVIKYQKAKGINPIGTVGPATRAALNAK